MKPTNHMPTATMANYCTILIIPSGTGKTVTGAHLAYALAMKLRREDSSQQLQPIVRGSVSVDRLRPCVMYCGPSNQAVNVVLSK